ncbi:MAG TPA: RsmE family RNA methyltransferase [Chitinophagaceae bacterium]|nr:RsmE family RNA methyltransferase [Chitinophagaceae bacterium]
MSLPYFFIENVSGGSTIVLPEETSKHCIQVLRMKVGEQLQLTNGKGNLITASITNADKKHCGVIVEERQFQQPTTKKISIAISLLKNANRFEWFLEKVTEIGVSEIIPMICERTEREHFRFERMNNILIAAMLQSEQTWLPVLCEPQTFEKIIDSTHYKQKLIAHCENDAKKNNITSVAAESEIQILIGPEGDFTTKEIKQALKNNYVQISLGNTRLRSETAGVVAATLLMNC